jgi:penicillin amidase
MRILVLAVTCLVASSGWAQTENTVQVRGLTERVEILHDRWGIAHIYARNEADLFFAQGYNAARDRLFQLELWRLQASGTAAAVFGARELKRDIGARLHAYRGDLAKELAHYHPRGALIVGAFVKGINAWIEQTERDPSLLPIEFDLLGIKPGRWTEADVISRHQGLFSNLRQEVANARFISTIGAERLQKLHSFQGGDPQLIAAPGVDLGAIPENVLELYTAFRDPLKFTPEQVAPAHRNDVKAIEQISQTHEEHAIEPLRDLGSNNWVVHGGRTQSRYPLLANDPHRALSAPSLRYWVHLVAPGWNVIGAGEPALPGVSIGHNEYGAWGLTIFGADMEDLYVYETHPDDPNTYRYRGRWERMRIEHDTIEVKDAPAASVTYKYTRHGPVLFEDVQNRRAYALRAAWRERGGAPYLASLRMNQARSWEEFQQACTFNHAPAENMVWADRKGNIGWQATGIRPLRPNWSGLLPVPGDGRFEWRNFLPMRALPNAVNPASGYLATANNFLMPVDFAWPQAMSYEWTDPYRAARIEELLATGRTIDVSETIRMQNDELSIPARALVALLPELPLEGAAGEARDALLDWDFVMDRHSVAAGIYAEWRTKLLENFRELILAGHSPGAPVAVSMRRMIDQLYAPSGDFGADPLKGRDELLVRSLQQAVESLAERLGPQVTQWHYGQLEHHHVLITHPLSPAVNEALRAQFEVGPAPQGGDAYTLTATGLGRRQTAGGTFKIIADVSEWDNSVGINSPGQSGDVRSPHYRDLFELWIQGKYFPLAYSRSKVESVSSQRTILTSMPTR